MIKTEKFQLCFNVCFDPTHHSHVLFLFSWKVQSSDFRNLKLKDNVWQKILGEILKRFLVSVEI